MPKMVSVLVDDEDVTYHEEKTRKKIKVYHFQNFKANSEDPSEYSEESKEIITWRADLEDGIIKIKQNFIWYHLRKTNLTEGGSTFQLNVKTNR